MTIICQICEREFKSKSSLSSHIRVHKISLKEYYDKYLIKKNENICPFCHEPTKFVRLTFGYRKTCTKKRCVRKCAENTSLKKFGYTNANKCKQIRDKGKKTKLEKYGDEKYVNREKAKETMMKKYGVSHNSKLQSNKDKCRKSAIKHFGGIGFASSELLEKVKNTNNERYGCDYAMQLDEIKNKVKATKKEKYGNENYTNVNKNKATKLERYGDENYHNKVKAKETMMKKYGVEYPSQDPIIHEKMQKNRWKKYTLPSGNIINIQGYEHFYLDEYFAEGKLEEDIIYRRKDMPKIWYYTDDNKKHIYFPDFYISKDNLIVEVKSTWTMKKYLEINLLKQQACIEAGYNFEFKIY